MNLYQRGKKGTWWVDLSMSGVRARRSLHTSDRKEAEKRAAALMVKASRDEWEAPPEPISPREFITQYLAHAKANKRPLSYSRDRTTLQAHFLPFLHRSGIILLTKLTPKAIEEYKIERRESVTARTLNRELETIKAALNTAVDWGHLRKSPAERVKKIRVPQDTHPRYWRQEEVELILTKSKQGPGWLYHMILTATLTGMRRGELCNLMWSDVDWGQSFIHVRGNGEFHTKTLKPRQVPMTTRLQAELAEWQKRGAATGENGPYVFGVGPRDDRHATKMMRALLKNCGLWWEGAGWHTYRHTFATMLAMSGCPMPVLASYLGHAIERTTELYAHIIPDLRHGFIAKLDGSLNVARVKHDND